MFIAVMCLFLAVGLVQVVRPQLLWGMNRHLQRGWVKDPDATEPTRRGYAFQRAFGLVFLVVAVWILVTNL
ncbi:DUF6199 family natural product biosynthesis protein [Streptomyces sp. NBC_01198]|uniref:DUF6199 family natural product biosynthesis protein n=1 Tax=Streptomyces sp. NBC_01198 TaxID=2903769 RepID=UPI002E10D244|nr:DUF6199 family natural product biosynthesis protein [Streptomyces sp. NBC_01198]